MKTTTTRGQLTLDTSSIDIHFYFPILRLFYCLFVFNILLVLKLNCLAFYFRANRKEVKLSVVVHVLNNCNKYAELGHSTLLPSCREMDGENVPSLEPARMAFSLLIIKRTFVPGRRSRCRRPRARFNLLGFSTHNNSSS